MGEVAKIEWCDHTFNGWIGCTEISPACDNCYARTLMQDRFARVEWGAGKPRALTSEATWKKPLAWNKSAEKDGVRRRVFANSLSDVFDSEVDDTWRFGLFSLIRETPALDWLLLTKRASVACTVATKKLSDWPQNAWLGVTVEEPKYLTRLEKIRKHIDAPVFFASVEPLVSPFSAEEAKRLATLADWVIVGGESGKGYRDMPLDWARVIRDACAAAGTPFFFKQTAGKKEIPADLLIRELPKGAGR